MSNDQNLSQQDFESELASIWKLRLCHHAIQAKIGQELRAHYELPQVLPHRMIVLLVQLHEQRVAGAYSDAADPIAAS